MSYRGKDKSDKFDGIPLHSGPGRPEMLRASTSHIWKPKLEANGWINVIKLLPEDVSVDVKVIGSIIVSWVVIVHFVERSLVRSAMKKCKWQSWESASGNVANRMVIIADPQLVDDHSYPNRPAIINYFVKKISDNYMYRNNKFVQHFLDPDTTIFLGDLFDGGRDWGNDAWFKEYKRFVSIFPKKVNRRTIQSLPGNHDIGFEDIDFEKVKRFALFFGLPNSYHEFGGHYVIFLDTISLSYKDPLVQKQAREFLDTINDVLDNEKPRILFTHVPLYKLNDQRLCGPLRESTKPFPIQKGEQYQTVIDYDLTNEILHKINPVLIYSGDDHDYCDMIHNYDQLKSAREITVKTVSMTGGIKYPAIQLLSLYDPNTIGSTDSYSTQMCYMPSPYFALNVYVLGLILTIIFNGLYFLLPQYFMKIRTIIESKLATDIALPLFNSTTISLPTVSNYRTRNTKAFVIHCGISIAMIYFIIGIYYRYL